MISVILWICVLSSGSVLAAVVWNRKYEEILPITCSGIIGILFLFGVFGKLKYGAYFIVLICGIIYIYTIYVLYRRKTLCESLSKLVTPASIMFFLFIMLVCYCNYGRRAYSHDEFSHWMDIVKVATTLDAFGTHPEANSIFPAYPPGMVLFQYMFQKIDNWCQGTVFSEWRAYVAYQVFFASFLLVWLKNLNFKKFINVLLTIIILLICPVMFFPSLYTSTYIDPILGILTGCGMARVLLERQKDIFYDIYVIAISCMLVLMKDAGMLFSIFLLAIYSIDIIIGNDRNTQLNNCQRKMILKIKKIALGSCCVFLCKGLWEWHVKWMGVGKNFSKPYDMGIIWDVICGRDTGYRSESWNNFWDAIINKNVILERFEIDISHFNWMVLLVFFLIGMVVIYAVKEKQIKKSVIFAVMEILLLMVYIVGLSITYITKFSEREAVKLASFNRYMDIGYLSLYVTGFVILLYIINQYISKWNVLAILPLCMLLYIMPFEGLEEFLTREEVQHSQHVYEKYNELISNVEKNCESGTRIYYIAQETSGYERLLLCYATRPVKGNVHVPASIGEPFYEGDSFTRVISPKEWQTELMQEFDYVGLYKVNDYFIEVYGELFENPKEITNNSVYKINKENGMLIKCK